MAFICILSLSKQVSKHILTLVKRVYTPQSERGKEERDENTKVEQISLNFVYLEHTGISNTTVIKPYQSIEIVKEKISCFVM